MCSDDDVIITMDLEDNIPSHVTRMHPYSGHWTELIAVPDEPALDGCMYFAIVSNTDIDPDKEKEQLGDEHRRKLSNNDQALGAFHFGQDSFFPFATRPEGRKLQSCSQYNAIRLAIQYDSVFCTKIGGGTAEGAKAAIHSIINTMNKFFQASPLCFTVESCDIKGYCSASNDPLQGVIESATKFCGSGNTLFHTFRAYVNGNHPQGCDTTHLVFSEDLAKLADTSGCAAMKALCSWDAIGTSKMLVSRPQMSHVKLLAHELGHNLNLKDHYPQDTTYIMGTGEGDAGFKPERMSTMQDFVNQKRQEDPSCTAVTTQVVDLDTDGLYIKPDVKPGIECAAYKVQGKCTEGWLYALCETTCNAEGIPVFPDVNPGPQCAAMKVRGDCDDDYTQFWTYEHCSTTCNAEGIPVYPDVNPGPDCAAKKRRGDCDDQYQFWTYENCSTTCNAQGIPVYPDTASAETCAYWKSQGNCDDGNQYQYAALLQCSTTCAGGTGGGTTGGGTDGGTTGGVDNGGGTDGVTNGGGEPIPDVESAKDCAYWWGLGNCDDGNQWQAWMLENCATTCATPANLASAQDCAYWKGLGNCDDGNQWQAWMLQNCATTCATPADWASAEDCAYWKGLGNCDDGNQYHGWMIENCATTCLL